MKNPTSRGRLFRKYVVVLLVLVGGVLMASSLVELYFAYRETQGAIVRVERAKAVAAAARIEQFLKEIELQVRETTRTASDDPDASQVAPARLGFRQRLAAALTEPREPEFLRGLRHNPAAARADTPTWWMSATIWSLIRTVGCCGRSVISPPSSR